MSDLLIEITNHGSMYWISRGEAIHIPTGIMVEFEERWNNRCNRRRAIAELQTAVYQHLHFGPDID